MEKLVEDQVERLLWSRQNLQYKRHVCQKSKLESCIQLQPDCPTPVTQCHPSPSCLLPHYRNAMEIYDHYHLKATTTLFPPIPYSRERS
jgi:hypothetical protein